MSRRIATLFSSFALFLPVGGWLYASALDVPEPGEIEKMKEAGTHEERLARASWMQPHRFDEGLRQRASYKVQKAGFEAGGRSQPRPGRRGGFGGPQLAFPFTKDPELKSKGTVRTLTVPIEFKDYRASFSLPGLTPSQIHQNIYGSGTEAAQKYFPYESVNAYYRRASQGRVELRGDVLDWFLLPGKRADYEPAVAPEGPDQNLQQARLDCQAIFDMVTASMEAADDEFDYAQYDNDNDGDIDLVTILYTGPHTGWYGFWWAYQWNFQKFVEEAKHRLFDGKRLNQFVFQFVKTRDNGADFNPHTLIHEMGHAFGLPDYYDYKSGKGPDGGIGSLDMMDGNWGNHNAFSRWLLDWIELEVIGSGPPKTVSLVAAGSQEPGPKGVAVFPGLSRRNAPDQEMFIAEYRAQVGNDEGEGSIPGRGLLIWHVDASVDTDEDEFSYDNSYTNRKLIRLVRADSPEDFCEGERAGPDTFFSVGQSFAPPSSNNYEGLPTNVFVSGLRENDGLMIASVGFQQEPEASGDRRITGSETRDDVSGRLAVAAARSIQVGDRSPEPSGQPPIDLDSLEQFDQACSDAKVEELLEVYFQLRPAFSVGEPYPPQVMVATLAGNILSGFKIEDNPERIVLQDELGERRAIRREDVDELQDIDLSRKVPKGFDDQVWVNLIGYHADPGRIGQSVLLGQTLLVNLAQKNGKAAVEALVNYPTYEFVRETFPLVMEAWAHQDPEGALAWYINDRDGGLWGADKLVAGTKFAEEVFESIALKDRARAIAMVDQLQVAADLWGAMRGVRKSTESFGGPLDEVDRQLMALDTNGGKLRAMARLGGPFYGENIVETTASNDQFSTFVAAIKAADLAGTLQSEGPFTVFAPTDEAFAQLPEGTLEALLKPENKEMLVKILTYHIVPGKVMAADVVKLDGKKVDTAAGAKATIWVDGSRVMVDKAKVVKSDIEAENGVIHVIDKVILPPSE